MVLNSICKSYKDKVVFDNFSYAFEEGKITAILGESGVGKTTLLNIIAGLTDYEGSVEKKELSVVFQNDRLIPRLTVEQNLKIVNEKIDIDCELEKVELKEAKKKFPSELSAGMSRRVAILRALNFPSQVLLMDEPFRNLDFRIKNKMTRFLKERHKKEKQTIIFVTHDINEAVSLADRILILKDGKIAKEIKKVEKSIEGEILDFFGEK